ncbi:hypothetical protein [Streptodolium elevatio]|uniref:CopG family transcriptional regulator n=1 Tax=Streptodolium elevatio TaxID=3157996 RepID=A0ABV3DBM0_9ACTN
MGSERITIVLTGDEALVLADWLRRSDADDAVRVPVAQVLDAVERRMGSAEETAEQVRAARDRLAAER